jgi:hypothetical protein
MKWRAPGSSLVKREKETGKRRGAGETGKHGKLHCDGFIKLGNNSYCTANGRLK